MIDIFTDITKLFFYSFITNYFYFSLGLIALSKSNINKENNFIFSYDNFSIFILGFILISSIALFLNFFFPLSENLNSAIYLAVLSIGVIFIKKIFKKKNIIFVFIISILTSFLILYSNVNRPDAYLYHLPYISILNINEIIIGLNNINFRYGLVSILQYTSAINVNLLFKSEGILIPSASIISLFIYYFYNEIKKSYKTKNLNYKSIFSLTVFIYIIYKVIRYSEFGNDALPALMTFFLISKILEKNFFEKNIIFIYLITVFIFLNKTTMIFLFLLPTLIFFLKKNYWDIKEYLKIIISFPTLILFLWLCKNFLISGCLIYPLYNTCLDTSWSNIQDTKKVSIEAEAWSKAWPENKKKNLKFIDYNKDFNWIAAWKEKHMIHILKIIAPFMIAILFILLLSYKKTKKEKFFRPEIFVPICVTFIGCVAFFLKFPLYRYGYGYIVSLICLIFTLFISKNLSKEKFLKIVKIILIVSPFIFFGKQMTRIIKNFENKNVFPIFKKNIFHENDEVKIILNQKGLVVYRNLNYCFYSKTICTLNNLDNLVKIDKYKNYYIVKLSK